MRWNPSAAATNGYATHQYATDIGWATKQVKQIYNLYSLLDSYNMTLEIPRYK
jgi:mannosyl-glycoprotein endo-beta-N-acetylglucosaminidase